ncbi:winged helix-turn-helix domain-containing protein [Gloeocapsa sp. PCC 7428]|uniref:winged helix-turn-helix domain-containing protein n=1 Tax=Gloeocapsa sp. PCC 7428 TaxID=1173026 RepID=UPI0002E04C7E|nr:winged helix-turn-helix domain-containing protein [Gloeocapsa sp. PCC 7428]
MGYWGTQGYLSQQHKQEVLSWLRTRSCWQLEEVIEHLEDKYRVVFQSKQSYYDLLHQAGLSWKKSQSVNPKKNEQQIAQKKQQIIDLLLWHDQIAAGQVRVLFLDEDKRGCSSFEMVSATTVPYDSENFLPKLIKGWHLNVGGSPVCS